MSGEFEDQLQARLERELARAYLAANNPQTARYRKLAAAADEVGVAPPPRAPASRHRLAALVVACALVVGGAAVVDASGSTQGVLQPLLHRASGRDTIPAAPATGAPARPPIPASDAVKAPGGERPGPAPAGAFSGTPEHRNEAPPAASEPAPSPEQASGAAPESHDRPEPTPRPSCSSQPTPPSQLSPDPSPAPRKSADARPAESSTPERGASAPHDHCG